MDGKSNPSFFRGGIHFVENNEGLTVEDAVVDNSETELLLVNAAEEKARERAMSSARALASKKEKENIERSMKSSEKSKKMSTKTKSRKATTSSRTSDNEFGDIEEDFENSNLFD